MVQNFPAVILTLLQLFSKLAELLVGKKYHISFFLKATIQILGSILTGLMSDVINARATTCVIMLYLSVPFVSTN